MDTIEHLEANSALDVCSKRTLEYVVESLARFNRGTGEIILRAVSGNIAKALQVAQILSDKFGIPSYSTNIYTLEINGMKYPCLELTLRIRAIPGDLGKASYDMDSNFIKFPTYHLLLDSLPSEKGLLSISKYDGTELISITDSSWGVSCQTTVKQDRDSLNDIVSVYYRSGLLLSPYWSRVAQSLSRFDDIILGIVVVQ